MVDRYADVIVITLSTTGQHTRAFSADTGMGEALVVAVKRGGGAKAPSDDDREDEEQPEDDRTLYVNLRQRPASGVDAAAIGRAIVRLPGGDAGFIRSGESETGCYVRATLADGGCTSLREPQAAAAAAACGQVRCACRGRRAQSPWR